MTEKANRPEQEKAPQDALREEILADARRQSERLLRHAKRDAETLTEKAENELEAWRTQHLEKARAEGIRKAKLALAGIPLERGRMLANRIEAVLQEFYDEMLERCRDREGMQDLRGIVIALAAEAIRGMEGLGFVIEVPACDRDALGSDWLEEVSRMVGRPDLEIDAECIEDRSDVGPVVRDAAGRRMWDNRLVARLERQWPALRCRLAESMALLEAPAAMEKKS